MYNVRWNRIKNQIKTRQCFENVIFWSNLGILFFRKFFKFEEKSEGRRKWQPSWRRPPSIHHSPKSVPLSWISVFRFTFIRNCQSYKLTVQADLGICGLFICEFAFVRFRMILNNRTYPLIYGHPWSFYMRICYMQVIFYGPYLSHITRSACMWFNREWIIISLMIFLWFSLEIKIITRLISVHRKIKLLIFIQLHTGS